MNLSHPLFSCIITFYTLILLYFPQIFLKFALSPVFILTTILLLSLLRLGASQSISNENNSIEEKLEPEWVTPESGLTQLGFDPNPGFEVNFVEWDVRAPLEVIYEDEEGEEKDPGPTRLERYPSLSGFYPETDSDSGSSSDGDFAVIGNWGLPENVGFGWEEDDREGLIEIALDGNNSNKSDVGFHVEEENLIEIDISPVKNDEFGGGGDFLGSVNVD